MTKIGSRSISQRNGSADPDPHQNVMDPQHLKVQYLYTVLSGIRWRCFISSDCITVIFDTVQIWT